MNIHNNDHEHECLFCLSHDYEDYVTEAQLIQLGCKIQSAINTNAREKDVHIYIDSPDVEHDVNLQNTKTLFNYSMLFACECSIYAHPICMDEWLNNDSCCPICKEPHHNDTIINNVMSPPYQPDLRLRVQDIYENNHENNHEQTSSCWHYGKSCMVLSISATLFYVIYMHFHTT